jgi:hypothetical protein
MHVYVADINVSRVGLLFEKDLSHDSYFLRSGTQPTQIKSSYFKTFLDKNKLQRLVLKNAENVQLSLPRCEPQTLKFASLADSF